MSLRADRLISIVLLLQRHGHMTASFLARSLGVTERTIYRDIEAISIAGVPIYTRSGPEGGVFLDAEYRSQLNWFTEAELQALLYTGSASPLAELGLQQAMDNAVLKLLALFPARAKQDAERMRQRLYLDPAGWYGLEEAHPTLPVLKEAVWNDLILDATYQNWEGIPKSVSLAPYSLVYKVGNWYLVAANQPSGALRTYRAARLGDIRVRDEHFERPLDFDIAAYWAGASESFKQGLPAYPAKLRVRRTAMLYFQQVLAGRYEIVEELEGWLVLQVRYMVFEEARTSVLGLGTDVEVIEPAELHAAVLDLARALVDKYGG
jgi:predicted DNA-binding transcriptional regulator YafY